MNRRQFFLTALAAGAAGSSLPVFAAVRLPGKLIVVRNIGEFRVLYALDPRTGAQTRISKVNRQEDGPCLSPDGKTLLFAGFGPPQDDWMVYSMDMVRREPRALVRKSSWPVCWLPDGRFIAVLGMELWTILPNGQPEKLLCRPECSPVAAALTGSGSLVYGDGMEPTQLHVVDLQTGKERRLAQGYGPVVLRDGRVVYQEEHFFYSIPLSGGKREKLARMPRGASNLCASPDRRFLVFSTGCGSESVIHFVTEHFEPVKTIKVGSLNSLTWGA